MKVGIIGGGVGGLAAGYEFAKAGHSVELFERAPFLGGLASTFDVGGGQLERFYHHLFLSDVTIIGLLDELGLKERLIWEDSKVGYFTHGRIFPFATATDLLRFNPVGFLDRIRMGLVTLYIQRIKNWKRLEDTTAAAFMRKWAGRRNYEEIWEPLLRGKFGRYAEQIAMPWMWSKFATRVASRKGLLGREQLGYIEGSWQVLIDALEQRISDMGGEVRTGVGVSRIETTDNRVTGLTITDSDGAEEKREYDAVLATVPSFLLPRLVELPEDYLNKVSDIEYEGAIAVIWVMNRSLSPIYWLNIADGDIPFLLALEQTNLVHPSVYGGKHILYTADYVTPEDPRWGLSDDELIQGYVDHLRKINPEFDLSWVENTYVHREGAAQPIMTTHFSAKIPPNKTPVDGLWLAAMSQIYPEDRGTNYSIRQGQDIARSMMAEAATES